MNERPVTSREIAERLGVSRQTVVRLAREGKLPHMRVGKVLRFQMADVMKAVQPK